MPLLTTKLEKGQGTFVSEPLSQKNCSAIKFKRLCGEGVEGGKFLHNYSKKGKQPKCQARK